jgi:hypothetical protein
VSSEIDYRAYVVGLDGHFLWSNEFLAPHDEAAASMLNSTLMATTLSFGVAIASSRN